MIEEIRGRKFLWYNSRKYPGICPENLTVSLKLFRIVALAVNNTFIQIRLSIYIPGCW